MVICKKEKSDSKSDFFFLTKNILIYFWESASWIASSDLSNWLSKERFNEGSWNVTEVHSTSLNIDFHEVLVVMHLQRTFLTYSMAIWINDIIAKANHYQYCKNKSIKIYHAWCCFHPSFEQSINKSINNAVNKEIIKHCSLALTLAGN